MRVDTVSIFYFSPTGGTEHVAGLIGAALGRGAAYYDMTVKDEHSVALGEEDLAILCVPVYGGRVPAPVEERLTRFSGTRTNAALVAVFGNRAVDDALLELRDMAARHGFRTIAAAEFVTPHSVDPSFGAGRPDAQDQRVIAEFAERLLAKAEQDAPAEITPPGKRPYVKYDGIPVKPAVAGTRCIRCGICAAECPAGAIDLINPKLTDKSVCISCMRCIHACTQGARHIPAAMKTLAGLSLKKLCAGRKEPKLYF